MQGYERDGALRLSGKILCPDGLVQGEITVRDGRIAEISPQPQAAQPQATQPDQPDQPQTPQPADDLLILPGFADVHNHGGAGESFPTSDQQGCAKAARHHLAHGTTTLLASTVSMREPVLLPQLAQLAELAQEGLIAGIHAEGPFVNACRCGAQDPDAIIDGDPELFAKMIKAAKGYLRSVTLAPETANVEALIDACVEHNVIVSFGHSDADFSRAAQAINYAHQAGATITATHLFNAMPPLHHRNPGVAAALIEAAGRGVASVELIADGVHLSDDAVAMLMASLGPDHITFVSDAMGAAGKADGDYMLGALEVQVRDGVARLRTEDGAPGAIAGGTSRIIDQVRRQVKSGHSLESVVRAATTGHELLGVPTGLKVGNPADLVVCTPGFEVQQVLKRGQLFQPDAQAQGS
ncbi:N-acetylglucosamine-6-phosphate deacetylase [Corynebacterium pseudopelargi]|uniref:N-acetylglucosamine-6-phosphate deacetylase n=1 Tax=Corynebacterium pseudopelargi TaxID=2080757 RepID=A0A3G6IWF1_9CORY|nr:N-acetylglucosamine-6-phosphate deacetylase [Corynebacterium pseudopelargi]AZA09987.1 N-acetylglucosamine-6-phosphate deacetylase [Corynebacterium pseudopelargi]